MTFTIFVKEGMELHVIKLKHKFIMPMQTGPFHYSSP